MNRKTLGAPAGLLLAALAAVFSQVPAHAHAYHTDLTGQAHFEHTLTPAREADTHQPDFRHGAAPDEDAHSTAAYHEADADAAQHSDDAGHVAETSAHAPEAAHLSHHEGSANHHEHN